MTKNTFRQYRVLGKGGFGEVSDQHFLCIRGTRQPPLPAGRCRPELAIRVARAAPVPGGRCCWLGGLCWALLYSGHCMSSQFPFEGQELLSCQALELWEVLHRAGDTCPMVCAAAWAESQVCCWCLGRGNCSPENCHCQASFCCWSGPSIFPGTSHGAATGGRDITALCCLSVTSGHVALPCAFVLARGFSLTSE